MINISRRILVYLLIFASVALIVFFSYSMAVFPENTVFMGYKTGWVMDSTLILFIDNLLTIHIAAVMAACSLFFKAGDLKITLPFHSIIGSSLILFLILAFMFALLSELLLPVLHVNNASRTQKSAIAAEYLETAREAENMSDWVLSARNYNLYLSIIPEDEEIKERTLDIQERVNELPAEDDKTVTPQTFGPLVNQTALDLIERADRYFVAEDYFSAQYYASRALELDPDNLQARRIIARAEQKIEAVEPNWREKTSFDFYARKVEGHRKLVENQAIEAYHIFNDLRKEAPNDSDVQTFFQLSLEAVKDVSFFLDDARRILDFTGYESILFINTRNSTTREVVYIEKLVLAREGTFFRNIEVMAFSPGGSVAYHFSAPYGVAEIDTINMLCIDRDNDEVLLEPQFHSGKRTPAHLLQLNIDAEQLKGMSISGSALSQLSVISLWKLAENYDRFGYPPEPVRSEILMRFLSIFNFLILSFFAAGFGWSKRNRYGSPPVYTMIIVPLLPLISFVVIDLIQYISRVFFSLLILQIGFSASLTLMLVVESLLFLLSLFYIAAQKTNDPQR